MFYLNGNIKTLVCIKGIKVNIGTSSKSVGQPRHHQSLSREISSIMRMTTGL